jgi:hypothetical protein
METCPYPQRSEDGALRLFMHGYTRKVQPVNGSRETWLIPSETETGTRYTLSLDPKTNEISCSCKSGTFRGYCKHSRFLQYALGLATA